MKRSFRKTWWLAAIVLICSSQSQAAIVGFTDAASFEAAAGPSNYFEDFSAYDAVIQQNLTGVPTVIGILSLQELPGTTSQAPSFLGIGDGNTTIDGGRVDLRQGDFAPLDNAVVFSFSSGITAFGFDVNPAPNRVGFQINIATDTAGSTTFFLPATDVTEFRGFLFDTQVNAITFSVDFQSDVAYGVDNVRAVIAAVPEPSALALFGLGLLGLGPSKWRKLN